MAETKPQNVEQVALEIFELNQYISAETQKSKPDSPYDLSEAEFLALDALQQNDCRTVGDLQRQVGVLPAQMSRIMKSLEVRYDRPLISRQINQDDKRKIDVRITGRGHKAADAYRRSFIDVIVHMLKNMPRKDVDELIRIMKVVHQALAD